MGGSTVPRRRSPMCWRAALLMCLSPARAGSVSTAHVLTLGLSEGWVQGCRSSPRARQGQHLNRYRTAGRACKRICMSWVLRVGAHGVCTRSMKEHTPTQYVHSPTRWLSWAGGRTICRSTAAAAMAPVVMVYWCGSVGGSTAASRLGQRSPMCWRAALLMRLSP